MKFLPSIGWRFGCIGAHGTCFALMTWDYGPMCWELWEIVVIFKRRASLETVTSFLPCIEWSFGCIRAHSTCVGLMTCGPINGPMSRMESPTTSTISSSHQSKHFLIACRVFETLPSSSSSLSMTCFEFIVVVDERERQIRFFCTSTMDKPSCWEIHAHYHLYSSTVCPLDHLPPIASNIRSYR